MNEQTPEQKTEESTLRGFILKSPNGETKRILGTYKNGTYHDTNGISSGLHIGKNTDGSILTLIMMDN